MDSRYSIDIASPITPLTKEEQEGQGLLPCSSPLSDVDESGRARSSRNLMRWRRVLNPVLAALTLLSSLLAVAGWVLYLQALPGLRLLGETNGLVPEFPVRPVVFKEDYMITPDHRTVESANATYDYWVSFMPLGNGFMAVEHDDGHILAPPMVWNQTEFYSIAVFHQLHCLHSLMRLYNDLADNLELAKRGRFQDRADDGHHHEDPRHHADHCFRYLQQSIVCCGDTALEGQSPVSDIPATDGTGATHMCKDFDMVKAWAQENRMDDAHYI